MRKNYGLLLLFLLGQQISLFGQSPQAIIQAVTKAQQAVRRVSYTLARRDTLSTGATRLLTGNVIMQAARQDSALRFLFWAKQDGIVQELVYDGLKAYELDAPTQTYAVLTHPAQIRQLLNQAGGRLLVPDLLALDTTKARSFSVAQDAQCYYLTINYPDLPKYDVRHRCKVITIARHSMLPTVVKRHQVTLGKVQTLIYAVQDLKINEEAAPYNFSAPAFFKQYTLRLPPAAAQPVRWGVGQQAPVFQLPALDQHVVSLADLRGKVILLDFWEVWCGPCVEAMPKIQQLHEHYAAQGLQVYGIVHENEKLEIIKKLLASQKATFTTLLGTAQSKQAYRLSAVPLYVLIDRQGIIRFQHAGFSSDLEMAIQAAVRQ